MPFKLTITRDDGMQVISMSSIDEAITRFENIEGDADVIRAVLTAGNTTLETYRR